jgi:hypothetical protein
MSFHYEVVISLFLRDDTPSEVLDELRWHIGLSEQQPATSAIDVDYPLMRPGESYLPGGDIAVLQRQYRYDDAHGVNHHAWGLYVLLFWLDDDLGQAAQITTWLAPYADEDGYIGSFREEADEQPTLLAIRDGELHLIKLRKQPRSLS